MACKKVSYCNSFKKLQFEIYCHFLSAKVAVQVYLYYRQSLSILEYAGEDLLRDKTYQEWNRYLHFKRAYYKCIALLYQGQQAEEQQKMGERVAYYQAACEQLEEAKKYANTLKNKKVCDICYLIK